MKPIKILMVEHNPDDIELIMDELKAGGIDFKVEIVQSEHTYRNAIKDFIPDIILSDYSLPSFDGTEAFKIRELLAPQVPFIFVSGSIGEEKSIEYIKSGVTDYVLKDKLFTLSVKVNRALKDSKEKLGKKNTEQELLLSESMLARAQHIAKLGSWELNFIDNTLRMSEEGCRIFGFSSDQNMLSFESWTALVHPEDIDDILEKIKESKDLLADTSYQHRIVLKDGTIRHINSESKFEFDINGNPTGMFGTMQDITEGKISEEAIRKAYEEKNTVLERIDDGFFATDENSIITYWNKRAEILLDVRKEDVIDKNLHEVFAATSTTTFYENYRKALNEKISLHFESFSKRTQKWFAVSAFGADSGLSVYFKDITERKNSENKIKESERKFRQIVETAQEGIWLIDENNNTSFVNKKMADMLEYSQEEMFGRPNYFFMDDEWKKKATDHIVSRKLGNSETHDFKYITKTGKELWTNISTNPVFDDDGIYRGALAMITDITATRKAAQNNKFKAELLNTIGQAVIATDLDGNINFWNTAATEMYGWTYSESIGKNVLDLIPTQQTHEQGSNIMKELSAGNSWSGEFMAQRQNGESFPIYVTNSPIYDQHNSPSGIIGVSSDITQRKKTEQEIAWLINNTEESFILLNRQLEITSFNDQAKRLYAKYLGKQLTKGDYILDYAQADRYNLVKEIYERVLKGAEETDEIVIRSKGKPVKNFALKYKPAKDEQGEIIGAFVSAIDITAKKESEQQLIVQEKRYRALVENGADAVAILSPEGQILYVSPTIGSILGYTETEIMKIDIFSMFHPADIQGVAKVFEKVMKSLPGVAVPGYTSRMKHKNGSWRWLEATMTNMLHDPAINGIVDNFRDVTEKIESEQLREFERREKEALINNTSDLIWSITSDFKLIAANHAFLLSLKKAAGILLKPGDELVMDGKFPEDYLLVWKNLYLRALTGESFIQEIYTPGWGLGDESWSETRFNPIYSGDLITGIACYSRNTTAARHFQNKLLSINSKLETAQQIAQLGYWELSLNKEKLYWSKELYAIWGVAQNPGEISFRQFFDSIHPDDRISFDRSYKNALHGIEKMDLELRVILPDGSTRTIHHIGDLAYDEAEIPIHFEGTSQDITDRKNVETLLLERNSQLVLAADMAKLGYWEYDILNDFFTFNDQFYAIFKTNAAAVGGYTMTASRYTELFVHPDDRGIVAKSVEEAVKSGDADYSFKAEHRIKYSNGEIGYISVLFNIAKDNQGRTVKNFGVNQDITEYKLLEMRLKELNQSLEKQAKDLVLSNAELEQFAYVASHDLQEPLRMVTSFLTQLERKYGPVIDEKGKEYIGFAVDGAKRMRQIILDLLEFSKIGRTEESKEKIDLTELVEEIKTLCRKQISEKNAIIKIDSLPAVYMHRVPLLQVFQNLISNALKYSKENVPSRIRISAEESETHWQFAITDNGIGIGKEYFDKIFIIFQRLHNKDEFSGTGMGLAVTKKIIENLGGKIWLESTEEEGSTFYFTLLKQ